VWRAASMSSRMLWIDPSSAPKRKMARHSAFLANRAACPSGSSGEFSARRICRYSDNTTGRFRARSPSVAQISPPPPPSLVAVTPRATSLYWSRTRGFAFDTVAARLKPRFFLMKIATSKKIFSKNIYDLKNYKNIILSLFA
jgi:hypothetical protein